MMDKTFRLISVCYFFWYAQCLCLSTFISAQGAGPWIHDTTCMGGPGDIGPLEKLLVWTDRDLYLEGDTIWLKIINTDQSSGRVMALSSTAYVELMGPGDRRLARQKISLSDEGGAGWISIPRNILSGNYYLRTYTSWMKNFDPAGYTCTLVTIINPSIPLHFSPYEAGRDSSGTMDVAFFPEGGHLISGIENRVYFRFSGLAPDPDPLQGGVRDERDSLVARLRFFSPASGYFTLIPSDTMDYHLSVMFGTLKRTWPVPGAQKSGYTMDWTESPDFLTLQIRKHPPRSAEKEQLLLTAKASGRVLFSLPLQLENGAAEIMTDPEELEGISTEFVLSDMSGNSLCNRIIRRPVREQLTIEIGAGKGPYGCRGDVPVSIRVSDASGRPVKASLCASVYLADASTAGRVEKAGNMDVVDPAFFRQWVEMKGKGTRMDDETIDAALSAGHLIHTHLNRGMEEPLQAPLSHPELSGPAISGLIMERETGHPATDRLVICSSLGSASQFQVFRTGEDGMFRFAIPGDAEQNNLVFRALDQEKLLDIKVEDPFSERRPHLLLPPLNLDVGRAGYIEQLSINRQVMEAYRYPDVNRIAEAVPGKPSFFYGEPSETVNLEDFIQLPVMEEIFREIIKSVIVYRKAGTLRLGVIDRETREIIGDHPMFLLDGVPLFDHGMILGIDPALISIIHVVDAKYFMGGLEMDGIIDIRSGQGRFADFDLPASTVTCSFQSCAGNVNNPVKPGHLPDAASGGSEPDFRSLLYWNPDMTTGEDGRAEFPVHAADIPGNYSIVIHGISPDGRIGWAVEALEIIWTE
jgi:hypothetical protein